MDSTTNDCFKGIPDLKNLGLNLDENNEYNSLQKSYKGKKTELGCSGVNVGEINHVGRVKRRLKLRKNGVFNSEGAEKRNKAMKNKYTFEDFKNAVVIFINCFKRIKSSKGGCILHVSSGRRTIGLNNIVCSLKNEMTGLKGQNVGIASIEKHLRCLDFILSEDDDQRIRYKYIVSESGFYIFKFLWDAILVLGECFDDAKTPEPSEEKLRLKSLIENYISKFKDMLIYYGNLCFGPDNNGLEVNNSCFRKAIFGRLCFFLGKGSLAQSYKKRKFFGLDNITKDKRYQEFETLVNSFVNSYPKLKDVLEDRVNISSTFFVGKKRKKSGKSCDYGDLKSRNIIKINLFSSELKFNDEASDKKYLLKKTEIQDLVNLLVEKKILSSNLKEEANKTMALFLENKKVAQENIDDIKPDENLEMACEQQDKKYTSSIINNAREKCGISQNVKTFYWSESSIASQEYEL